MVWVRRCGAVDSVIVWRERPCSVMIPATGAFTPTLRTLMLCTSLQADGQEVTLVISLAWSAVGLVRTGPFFDAPAERPSHVQIIMTCTGSAVITPPRAQTAAMGPQYDSRGGLRSNRPRVAWHFGKRFYDGMQEVRSLCWSMALPIVRSYESWYDVNLGVQMHLVRNIVTVVVTIRGWLFSRGRTTCMFRSGCRSDVLYCYAVCYVYFLQCD